MRLILLSTFCLLLAGVRAQKAPFGFKNYSLEDGLSQSTVYSFLEDDSGYIWIGTRDGLNRFDADNFITFYPSFEHSNSISNRSVRVLVKDKNGFIWIGTDGGGVDRFDPITNTFTKLCTLVSSDNCDLETNITGLEASNNELLIGTRNQGLYNFNFEDQTLTKNLEIASTIWDIKSVDKKVLVATSSGMIIMDSTGVENILQEDEIKSITALSPKIVLLGSKNNGVLSFNMSTGKLSPFSEALSSVEISTIELDDDGRIWIGTDSQGVFLAERSGHIIKQFKSSNQQSNQLQSNSIRTVFKDSNGIVWIGTNNSGFSTYFKYRYQFNSYSVKTTNGGLSSDVILSFNELNNGNILIGTEQNGLISFEPVKSNFSKINALKSESIIAIEKDRKGKIWIATDGFGLVKIEQQDHFDKFKKIGNLTNESVLSLEVSENNEVIAGTYKGLNVIVNDTVQSFNYIPEYLQSDRILAVESLNNYEFLLGTFANGLVYFNRKNQIFERFKPELNNSKNSERRPERVQAIHIDNKDNIWLGTYSGLYLFDSKKKEFKSFSTKEGLPSDVVYGVLEDTDSDLWLSTNAGISKFDTETENFLNYSISDGLLSNEFNGGAYFIAANGNMYFGGVQGFTVFNPLEIKESYLTSKIIIYAMNVDGEIHNTLLKDEIRLNDRQDFIQFNFSYLNFINAEKYTLEYNLSGLSENWIPVKNRRTINFSGLSAGEYKFQLRAINNIGDVSAYSKTVSFYVKPPFWKTWYFVLFMVVLLTGSIYSLFRYRMFYMLKEEETRNRIARDLHDDLSATLSSISFFSEAAKREKDTSASHSRFLQRIDESALEAKEKINDIIWAIDPDNDDWNAFITKCKRYAAEMFESKSIEYVIDIDDSAFPT